MSVTCSGQNYRGDVVARTNSDIKGVIYSLDLRDKDKPWVEEISFPLNYRNNDGSDRLGIYGQLSIRVPTTIGSIPHL